MDLKQLPNFDRFTESCHEAQTADRLRLARRTPSPTTQCLEAAFDVYSSRDATRPGPAGIGPASIKRLELEDRTVP